MQRLFVKGLGEVVVHRSWKDISGVEVFLHTDGRYANKDGTPLKKREELDILPPTQRAIAQAWWDRSGKKQSEDHYRGMEKKQAAIAGDFQDNVPESTTELDSALYARRSRKGGAISAAKSWMEWFSKRPDWWGQAEAIGFPDFVYTKAGLEEEEEKEEPKTPVRGKKQTLKAQEAGDAGKPGEEQGPGPDGDAGAEDERVG